MSDYTEHYNLKKPEQSENYNVDDANTNNTIIDTVLWGKVDKTPGKGLSENDFTNLYKKKLDSLFNYDDTSITEEIESLDERKVDVKDFEKLAEENEFLRENQLYGEASGRNVNLQDSSKAHINLKPKGESLQDIRIGKNLLKLTTGTLTANGVTVMIEKDGLITLDGTITNNNDVYPIVKLTNGLENSNNVASIPTDWLKQNTGIKGTYTLEKIYVSGSTSYSVAPVPLTYSADGVRVDYITTSGSGVSNATVETDLAFVAIYLTTNGTKFTNYKFYLQVEEGTKSEVTEYEQYGTSPSPDYPSPIENITGDIEIKDVGENLVNPNNVTEGYVSDRSGLVLGISGNNKNTGYIEIIGGEKYYILSNKPTGNWGAWYDKDKKFISGITLGGNSSGIVTAPNNAYFINFTVSYENNNPDYANNVMIARSDKEIPYKPYQAQKVTFPLSEGQKLYKRSYLASDGINHTRKQFEIDVTQIRAVTSYNNIDYASIPKPADFIGYNNYAYYEILCNKAISKKITSWDNPENINKISSQAEKTKIYLGFEKGTTLEQMKTALANTVIEYELSEEEIVPYTTEQQIAWNKIKKLYTYKNVTNIFSNAELDIVYVRDLQTVINEILTYNTSN